MYQLAGESRTASTAKRAGGGAAIGAGVGAGAGTATNAARRSGQVNGPSKTLLEFRLAQPFTPQSNWSN
jgi:hypothetical protein